jgi:hypothetical protein
MTADPTPPFPYIVMNRGFETECWVSLQYRADVDRWFHDVLGQNDHHNVWMHLCERWHERNLCVRPSHLRLAPRSENAKHWQRLRRGAGVPWTGGTRKGHKMSAETRARMSVAAKARPHKLRYCALCDRTMTVTNFSRHKCITPNAKAKRVQCEVCSEMIPHTWLSRHVKRIHPPT